MRTHFLSNRESGVHWALSVLNCRDHAITFKFRLLSIVLPMKAIVWNQKMSVTARRLLPYLLRQDFLVAWLFAKIGEIGPVSHPNTRRIADRVSLSLQVNCFIELTSRVRCQT